MTLSLTITSKYEPQMQHGGLSLDIPLVVFCYVGLFAHKAPLALRGKNWTNEIGPVVTAYKVPVTQNFLPPPLIHYH